MREAIATILAVSVLILCLVTAVAPKVQAKPETATVGDVVRELEETNRQLKQITRLLTSIQRSTSKIERKR